MDRPGGRMHLRDAQAFTRNLGVLTGHKFVTPDAIGIPFGQGAGMASREFN